MIARLRNGGLRIGGASIPAAQLCHAPEFGRGSAGHGVRARQEPVLNAYRPERMRAQAQQHDAPHSDPEPYEPSHYEAGGYGAAPHAMPMSGQMAGRATGFSAPPRPAEQMSDVARPHPFAAAKASFAAVRAEKIALAADRAAQKAAGQVKKQAEKQAQDAARRDLARRVGAPQVGVGRPQPAAGHAPEAAISPSLGHPHIKRDPAPSRMAYRLQRLWLTPMFRGFTRIGLPIFSVVLGLGLWLGDDGRRADIVERYETLVRKVQERPEFMVSLLKIEGASPEVDAAIRTMMPVKLPASSFQIDLEALHEVITRLDAVAEAKLVIRDGGTLDVAVTERVPALLWRHSSGIELLDAEGHRVATLLERGARPDLPLIAGRGAEKTVPEALDILAAAAPILPRARGIVRVGERRWDIVLDRGQRILLPQDNPVLAVERLLAIDAAEDLMDRDFTHLDMRNQDRPTIRLSQAALEAFQTINGAEVRVKK